MDPTAIIVVGGAVLAPDLLASDVGQKDTTGSGLVDNDPRVVLGGHRTAAQFMNQSTVLGVGATKSSKAGLLIQNRLTEVFDVLIKTNGTNAGAPGLPKLSPSQCFDLISQLLQAVKLGLIKDSDSGRDGYVLDEQTEGCGAGGIVVPGCERIVSQESAFRSMSERAFGGLPDDIAKPTDLAKAIGVAINKRFLANTQSPIGFDSTDTVKAAFALAGEMDRQGVTFAPPGLGELVDAFDRSIGDLPGRVAGAVAGIFGDAIGSILFSTPVLVVVGGYIVYRAVRS